MIRNNLKLLIEEGAITEGYFKSYVNNFYKTIVDYLAKYTKQYLDFKKFDWTKLATVPIEWKDVEASIQYFTEKTKRQINENDAFDEICLLSDYVQTNLDVWSKHNVTTSERWVQVLKHFKEVGACMDNCCLIAQYVLSIPGTNAPTERVFSLMNALWTPEKSTLKVETVSAMLEIKYNMVTCAEFSSVLDKNPELLKKIHGVEKYDFKR